MDLAWRIGLAIIGLIGSRTFIYSTQWGHGGGIKKLLGIAVCIAMIWPLWEFSPASHRWLLGAGAIWLFPYRQLAVALLKRTTIAGARRLAREWGTSLKQEGDLWEVSAGKRWMGNVLTRMRSLHPGVSTAQTYYMLAFSVGLDTPPPFQCSIMRGWAAPKYFASEWRETAIMQGQAIALSLGEMLHEGGRRTGGELEALADWELPDGRMQSFAAKGTGRAKFDEVFDGGVMEELLKCASAGVQFELNVTPTSLNIYTVYCGFEKQKRNADFLLQLADKVL